MLEPYRLIYINFWFDLLIKVGHLWWDSHVDRSLKEVIDHIRTICVWDCLFQMFKMPTIDTSQVVLK